MPSKEVVERSAELMRGNRSSLFMLQFSFIGWAILAVLTFGIGLLWLLPYMQVATVVFYEKVLEKNSNNVQTNHSEITE